MVAPYCSRTFAYSVASASVPRAAPTRSAVVAVSASAYQRPASSSDSSRELGAATRPTPARLLVRSTDSSAATTPTGLRGRADAAGRRRAPARGTARRPARGRTPRRRSPPRRRTPRRSAACANPVASTVFSSRAMRLSSSRSATDPGPRSSASLAAASRSCRCSAGQTDVHSRSFSTRRNTFPEGRRGISVDENDPAGPLVGRQPVGDRARSAHRARLTSAP